MKMKFPSTVAALALVLTATVVLCFGGFEDAAAAVVAFGLVAILALGMLESVATLE